MLKVYAALVELIWGDGIDPHVQHPQKIYLTSAQHKNLMTHRAERAKVLRLLGPPSPGEFLGVPLEVRDSAPPSVVAHDGTEKTLDI